MDNLRKLAEITKMLSDAENDLATFFDLSADLFIITDGEGRFSHANPAWCHVLGYEVEDLIGSPVRDLIHHDDYEQVVAAHQDAMQSHRGDYTVAARFRHASGGYRWIMWRSTPMLNGKVYGVGRDMTAERKYIDRLEQAKIQRHIIKSLSAELRVMSQSLTLICERMDEVYRQMKEQA